MTPDWTLIFPDADHRWRLGLRRGTSLAAYFADADPTGAMRAERARWLADDPERYAACLPAAEPALAETSELARALGAAGDFAGGAPFERLLHLGRAWEPDFVWMHPGADGLFRLIGGVVCFPSAWALRDKLGLLMSAVHEPVPELNAQIGRPIDQFLAQQAPGVDWRRENWSVTRDGELNHHPALGRRRLDETVAVEDIWLRLEHQLLLKLPRSGSVLFGIRVEVVPFAQLLADAAAAARFARLLRTLAPAAARYKNLDRALPVLVALLADR